MIKNNLYLNMDNLTTSQFLSQIPKNNKSLADKNYESKSKRSGGRYNHNSQALSPGTVAAAKMGSVFWDFTVRPNFVTLVVEDKELHVHQDILTDASPVFKSMIESTNFAEKQNKQIYFTGRKLKDIQEMLNFIYPFDCQITEDSNLESLLKLSKEYEIAKIKDIVEKYLLDQECSINMLIVAQEYNLEKLLRKCKNYLAEKPLISLEQHSRFQEMFSENVVEICYAQLKLLQSHCQNFLQFKHEFHCLYNKDYGARNQTGRCKDLVHCYPCLIKQFHEFTDEKKPDNYYNN